VSNKTETLTYDNNSNITNNGLENYTYDSLNQLTQVTNITTPTVTQGFTYDLQGNRTQVTTGSGTIDYTKNALNEYTQTQVTSSGTTDTTSYIYDDNGNLTEDSVYKYIYDYKNRLVEVKRKTYDIVTTEEVTSTGITCPETGTGSTS
jgi:YD repeat-containing protein